MSARSHESIHHEVDYWMAALEDVRTLNELVLAATEPLPNVAVAALSLIVGADPVNATDEINGSVRKSMNALAGMNEPIVRLLALIEGRRLALQDERDAA